MDSMESIFSEFPQLRARFEDPDGKITDKPCTRILFLNILSIYGMADAVKFVDTMVISRDGEISILKDKPGRIEDDVHPIDLVSLFTRLIKENISCGIEVFDDMFEIELSEFVVKLMKKYHIKPMRKGPHGRQENF